MQNKVNPKELGKFISFLIKILFISPSEMDVIAHSPTPSAVKIIAFLRVMEKKH